MTAPITVRRIRAQELDRILLIEDASFGEDAYDRNLFAEFLDNCGEFFLIAERQGCICGYVVACIRGMRQGVRSAELISIAVDPQSRGLGAASRMMDSLLGRLRYRGVDRLTLMVRVGNQPALAFYDKYRFRRVRIVRRYYEDGADGFLMTLSLRSRG
jgi:ribosomal-protein-alanine N-acetyltransferase